ncbi:hypothetical protein C9I56_24165 [Paraburkholderia caribensis]|nr:hypothetical protein C9I56_24165 [Paraburkholderia caribensis]
MRTAIADDLKIHLMENHRRLLERFVTTGKAWKILVHDHPSSPLSAGGVQNVGSVRISKRSLWSACHVFA